MHVLDATADCAGSKCSDCGALRFYFNLRRSNHQILHFRLLAQFAEKTHARFCGLQVQVSDIMVVAVKFTGEVLYRQPCGTHVVVGIHLDVVNHLVVGIRFSVYLEQVASSGYEIRVLRCSVATLLEFCERQLVEVEVIHAVVVRISHIHLVVSFRSLEASH